MRAAAEFTFQYVSILITVCRTRRSAGHLFTFQYVSILIDGKIENAAEVEKFTFQYVSILIGGGCARPPVGCNIYIPICFYFNLPGMPHILLRIVIYIPICFYFNSPASLISMISFYLHSNMFLF